MLLLVGPTEVPRNDRETCCSRERLGVPKRWPPAAELSSCGHEVDCSFGPHRRTRSLRRDTSRHPEHLDRVSILRVPRNPRDPRRCQTLLSTRTPCRTDDSGAYRAEAPCTARHGTGPAAVS